MDNKNTLLLFQGIESVYFITDKKRMMEENLRFTTLLRSCLERDDTFYKEGRPITEVLECHRV